MTTLVFFIEEPSAKELLLGLLPKLLPEDIVPKYIIFEGKSDLDRQLVRKLRGWRTPDTRFVVLRDRDSGDCHEVKRKLSGLCQKANHPETLVRIACPELESWYLGDLRAVEAGLGIQGIAQHKNKSKYRNPDSLGGASAELRKLTRDQYQKISGSRAIAPHMDPNNNASTSFRVFVKGIRSLTEEA